MLSPYGAIHADQHCKPESLFETCGRVQNIEAPCSYAFDDLKNSSHITTKRKVASDLFNWARNHIQEEKRWATFDQRLHYADGASTAVPLALVSFFSLSAFFAAAICHAGMLALPPPEPKRALVGVPLREVSAGAAEVAGAAVVSGWDCELLPDTFPLVLGVWTAGAVVSVVELDEVPFAWKEFNVRPPDGMAEEAGAGAGAADCPTRLLISLLSDLSSSPRLLSLVSVASF